MKSANNFWRALLLLICLLCAGRTQAITFETIQSTDLGGGWFQYDVKLLYDPFFLQADLTEFAVGITNGVDVTDGTTPTNWMNDTNAASWIYSGPSQSRPDEQVFLIHSSATNHMLGTNAISLVSLITSDLHPGVTSGNIVGYINSACLLPCPPAMADNSPSNHLEIIELVPNLVIKKLLLGPLDYGLLFHWDSDSTDLLQASPDMVHWTNVTYLYGTNGDTLWRTNSHLVDHGTYFRLLLAAGKQTTNVAPLTASSVRLPSATKRVPASPSTPRVLSCKPQGEVVSVQVATTPGQTGQVRMLNSRGVVLQTQPFNATGNSVTVNFNSANVSGAVLFQAVADKMKTGL
jgi:hypothetical protein